MKSMANSQDILLQAVVLAKIILTIFACPLRCQCNSRFYVYCDYRGILADELRSQIIAMPTEARYVDLSENMLTVIPSGTFEDLRLLEDLDLSENRISNITHDSFKGLDRLRKLSMKNNLLSQLVSDSLSQMYNLRTLHLDHNRLSEIAEGSFSNLTSLGKLFLQHNNLTSVTPAMFSGLTTMNILDISHNSIERIHNRAFITNNQITDLNLNHNNITELTSSMFTGLSSLRTLQINHNNLTDIRRSSLEPFINIIHTLSLENNKIGTIFSETFARMTNLRFLNLRNNRIRILCHHAFRDLTLDVLSLGGNDFRSLNRTSISGIRSVEVVDLSDSNIHEMSTGVFDTFRRTVYELNLSANQLSAVKLGMFRKMSNIQRLDLSNNIIAHIEPGSLSDLQNLRVLDLSGNRLQVVAAQSLHISPELQELHLYQNPLQRFSGFQFNNTVRQLEVYMNLTVTESSETAVKIHWPYMEGVTLYWSVYIKCIVTSQCDYDPTDAEYIVGNINSAVISNLQPSSRYYICVVPTFLDKPVHLYQCGLVDTLEKIVRTTQRLKLPDPTLNSSTIISSSLHMLFTLIVISFLFC